MLLLSAVQAFAQSDSSLIERAKTEMDKPFGESDYSYAIQQLESALEEAPRNEEALYCLAYAYSRLNSPDARSIPDMQLALTLKASEALEQISPYSEFSQQPDKHNPRDKIASEWGSQALSYAHADKKDSLRWALEEGYKRGGFNDTVLQFLEIYLKETPRKALLLSIGDYYLFHFLYLQEMKNIRPDVQVVNVDLLNTQWYPYYLEEQGLQFDMMGSTMDSINYLPWSDSSMTLGDLSWQMPPSYGNYILRSDILLLHLLEQYYGKRPLLFAYGFPPNAQLGLETELRILPFFQYLPSEQEQHSFEAFMQQMDVFLNAYAKIPQQSSSYKYFQNSVLQITLHISNENEAGKDEQARKMMNRLLDYANSGHCAPLLDGYIRQLALKLAGE